MSEHWQIYADWNPWHGCTKISPGCKYCYVYRQDEMYGSEISSSECRKTGNFNLPLKRKRDKSWKIESGKIVFTKTLISSKPRSPHLHTPCGCLHQSRRTISSGCRCGNPAPSGARPSWSRIR